ncbi:related to AP-2 complex subunit beta [Saccharomycodes ludwigii]|uniref:AP complex subunit beta n=1 Tax=Saccharomycodes ludwigii TaxID=36035 RepID=A0A376B2B6_9ASCO|nr:related to AP-2 complex subunit beta [Saccharomycodes ludwigii]
MSSQAIFVKHKASELKQEYDPVIQESLNIYNSGGTIGNNSNKKKKIEIFLKKVVANFTFNNHLEMSKLYFEVFQCLKIFHTTSSNNKDSLITNLCYQYIQQITTPQLISQDLIQQVLKFIINDLYYNNNQYFSTLALETLCYIKKIPEYTFEALKYIDHNIESESNSSIDLIKKKTCIEAIPNLLIDKFSNKEQQQKKKIIDKYIKLLWDLFTNSDSSSIRASCLKSLQYLYVNFEPWNSNLQLSFDESKKIIKTLGNLNEWDKSCIINLLTLSVVPKTHEESYAIIDMILPQLQASNTSTVLQTIKFILYLSNYVEALSYSITNRISNSIIALLHKPNELKFLVLRNVILLLLSREHNNSSSTENKPRENFLNIDISYFFVEFDDPIYIKDTKLELLYLMADEKNISIILDELKEYAIDIDTQMSRKAIRAIGNLAVKLDSGNGKKEAIAVLLDLLDFCSVEYIVQEIISVFKNIFRKYPNEGTKSIISKLVTNYIDVMEESESKSAMIWILTEYSNHLPQYLTLFDEYFVKIFLQQTFEVQCSILTSAVKFFVRDSNKQSEEVCVKVLKMATEQNGNPDIRDKSFMYWRLLSGLSTNQIPVEIVKEIIDGKLPLITLNNKLDPLILEELELNIGSAASIYLKPVQQVFRQNKTRYLPQSPALLPNKTDLVIIHDEKRPSLLAALGTGGINSSSRTGSLRSMDSGIPSIRDRSGSRVGSDFSFETEFDDDPLNNFSRNNSFSGTGGGSTSPKKNISDYDKPVENVNQIKRKNSLVKKPSMLARKLTLKKKF